VGAYGPLTDEAGTRRFALRVAGRLKGVVIAEIEGVEDRDAAEALRGLRLHVERAQLPPPEDGVFYHADLIGLDAVRADGTTLGTVTAVHDYGAGQSLEIGDGMLVPFTREAVPVVDLAGRRLVVEPPVEVTP
jgi:16S rRNA processing protein RimM